MRFNHLRVPDQWGQYWTKYPQGYTILEALINWVSQVDLMVDNINNWNTYLDDFIRKFDKDLQGTVTDLLNDWHDSGLLAKIINEEVFNMKADTTYLNNMFVSVRHFGAKGDGVTNDSVAIQKALDSDYERILFDGTFLVKEQLVCFTEKTLMGGEIISNFDPLTRFEGLFHIQDTKKFNVNDMSFDGKDHNHRIFMFDNVENATLSNCTFRNVGATPVFFNESKAVGVQHSYFDKIETQGLESLSGCVTFSFCSDVFFNHNHIEECHGKGVNVSQSSGGQVHDNLVNKTLNDAGDGLYIGYKSQDITLRDNLVLDPQGNAIKCSGATTNIKVVNNTLNKIRGELGFCLMIQGCSLSLFDGNTLFLGGNYRKDIPVIQVEDHPDTARGSECKHNIISNNNLFSHGNTLTGSLHANMIHLQTRTDGRFPCEGHRIINNRIIGGYRSIYSNNVDGLVIQNNKMEGMAYTAVIVTAPSAIRHIVIEGNVIKNAKYNGIELYNVNDANVAHNTIESDTAYNTMNGVACNSLCNNVVIDSNLVKNFNNSLIVVVGTTSDNIMVSNNILIGIVTGIDFRARKGRIVGNMVDNGVAQKVKIATPSGSIIEMANGV